MKSINPPELWATLPSKTTTKATVKERSHPPSSANRAQSHPPQRVPEKGYEKEGTRKWPWLSEEPWMQSGECQTFPFAKTSLFTCSWRNKSLAICTIFSTAMMLPILWISISAIMVRTRMASTRSWRYSGWGTRFRTDSTWTENLISPGVIYDREKENHFRRAHHPGGTPSPILECCRNAE